jgi:plastocyanin
MTAAIRSIFPLVVLGTLLLSCSDDATSPAPDYTVSAGATGPTTLGTQVTFTVTLASTGFAGPVALQVTGAPPSWVVSIGDSTQDLSANGTATTTVTVAIPTNGAPAVAGDTLKVEATSTLGTRTAISVVTVANEYVVPIVDGAGTGAHWGALAGTIVQLNVGTRLTIRNDDAAGHNIHTGGTIPGFPHQDTGTELSRGETYSNVLSGSGTDSFYCHTHGSITGSITIVVP